MPADQFYLNGLGYKREALVVNNSFEFFVAILEA